MALRQSQELKQSLKLSPLQIQTIKLIECNALELEDKIKQEVEDNPAIEFANLSEENKEEDNDPESVTNQTSEEIILNDYISDDDIPDAHLENYSNNSDKQNQIFIYPDSGNNLSEFLFKQIELQNFDDHKRILAEYIIGNLDESGYLESELSAIADDIFIHENIEVSTLELEDMLYEIQDLDPAGVGARDLQESLQLQMMRREKTEVNQLALKVLEDYFEEFSNKHYDKIIRQLDISEIQLQAAIAEILSLNPKPGGSISNSIDNSPTDITPDFIVETFGNEIVVYLNNQNIPILTVNKNFTEMMKGYQENKESMSSDDRQALAFMKQKVDAAKSFIEAVKQRQTTLTRTMKAIVDFQYDFFLSEDESDLKPMRLKDISQATGYDISTISRVSVSKYVQTNQGIYSLKYFFSEGMQKDSGEDVTTREIKSFLKKEIEKESPSNPLTDQKLTEIMNRKGYPLARRTVAKYREELNIPVARLRRNFNFDNKLDSTT